MNPIDAAWNVLKALPDDEVVQNRYRFTGQGHPFLDANFKPTQEVKRDLVEQMRLGTRHPALNPAHVIESVGSQPHPYEGVHLMEGPLPIVRPPANRPTNITEGSHLTPIEPTDILRYPTDYNITGAETGRADAERERERRMHEKSQFRLTGLTDPPRLIDNHPYTHLPGKTYGGSFPKGDALSDEEMENLRQQAQQMPFSYEGQ